MKKQTTLRERALHRAEKLIRQAKKILATLPDPPRREPDRTPSKWVRELNKTFKMFKPPRRGERRKRASD